MTRTWPEDMARGHGQRTWPEDMARGHGQRTWPEDMARGHGQRTWPGVYAERPFILRKASWLGSRPKKL